tara:strand:- start:672 stop:1043 length:372 start_codon:yes stop_codon:yes gene_type:complete
MKKLLVLLFLLAQFPANAADKYTNFSVESLEKAKAAGKTLVINSYEPWCWSCRKQDKVLLDAKEKFNNVVFLTYQQGKNKDIAKVLEINFRSTIVVFKGKKEIARLVGQTDKSQIFSAIKKGI